MSERPERSWPPASGDFVLGNADSSVAVCTLASRRLLPLFAGRPEIAIAGRVYTENVGVERMVQNLVANPRLRVLMLCGRESPHLTGRTILSLHKHGVDADHRVVGAAGPEPFLPNLGAEELRLFQETVEVVDMIGELDAEKVLERARSFTERTEERHAEGRDQPTLGTGPASARDGVEHVPATAEDPAAWRYDPKGFFLIFVNRQAGILQAEHYTQERELTRIIEGKSAQSICHTILRLGLVTEIAHAAYLGRELATAEAALRFGLRYEQDTPLNPGRPA